MTITTITRVVSISLEVSYDQVAKKGNRSPKHVLGRQMIWSLTKHLNLEYTVEQIAEIYGIDHSTVSDGRKSFMKKLREPATKKLYQQTYKYLNNVKEKETKQRLITA